MVESYRPDPDAILAALAKSESASLAGSLRIFFGMSAGVGKTYAMLKAAQDRLREGVDVVVGVVETHGREDTEALLSGLEVIARRSITYRDVVLTEMDLDAIIKRKPKLVLVDELAHTNIPDSRHAKRWQDVLELLDAGIDVYSTLNVQHIESRKEYVEQITGIAVRETVPDSLLQRATQIIFVDLTPAELLQRLHEGKVYLGERAEAAIQNFFQEDRLTALREIALRLTAEAVDSELRTMTATREGRGIWKASERLMVAVSHSPHSEDLVRATRRLAFSLDAPWVAVHVNTGASLESGDQRQLAKNLALARELGGDVVSVTDVDIVEALLQTAQQRSVSQLVVGHPAKRLLRDFFGGGTLLDRLTLRATTFDIHVLKPMRSVKSPSRHREFIRFEAYPTSYWLALWIVVVAAGVSALVVPAVGYRAVGFIFLLGVLMVGTFVSIGPTVLAAALAAVTWDFFFIPPRGTFHFSEPEDMAMCAALFVSAAVTGTLTSRIRRREKLLRSREQRTNALYQIASAISASSDRKEIVEAVRANLSLFIPGDLGFALKSVDGQLEFMPSGNGGDWMVATKEWTVARWVFEHGRVAGQSTDTLASALARYIPLIGPSETTGVLAYRPKGDAQLTQDEENLLMTASRLLAVAAERELLRERSRHVQQLAESERLYQTILNSVSHELRTPLTAIIGNASALSSGLIAEDASRRKELTGEIVTNAERLNRVVTNLLDMSRLKSGKLTLKRDWHDLHDVVSVTLNTYRSSLHEHPVTIDMPETLPLVRLDFQLFQQALLNLLLNADIHTSPSTTIQIAVRSTDRQVELAVSDNGPGLSAESIPHLFELFYRAPHSKPGGAGIGLAIARGIVEAHGGTIVAENVPTGGARFVISLPVESQPQLPAEGER